jgi:hypothetical protein
MSMIASMIDDPDAIVREAGLRRSEKSLPALGTYSSTEEAGEDPLRWAKSAYDDFAQGGALPPPTQIGGATPVPFYLSGHPRWGRRNLFLFDAGGENFESAIRTTRNAPFLARSQVLWVVVSIAEADLGSGGGLGQRLWGLLDSAESAMAGIRAERGWPRTPQSLLVILQKADARGDVLPELDEFMSPEAGSSAPVRQRASDLLHEWVLGQRAPDPSAWLADRFARVEMCAVSATGSDRRAGAAAGQGTGTSASGGRLAVRPQPRRVLDPLLWTWDLADDMNRRGNGWRRRGRAAASGNGRRWLVHRQRA